MGYDVHKVELGIYENKLVIACRDFTTFEYKLYRINEVINRYTDNVEFKSPKYSKDFVVSIEELLFNFENNKDMKEIQGIKERFYDMFVIDAYINNNDRHNGNWGILSNEEEVKLSPIFDNGNSFFPKHDLEKIKSILSNENKFNSLLNNGKTPYEFKGKKVDSIRVIKKLSLNLEDKSEETLEFSKQLKEAVKRVIPKIKLDEINKIIDEIPEKEYGIDIMQKEVKEF